MNLHAQWIVGFVDGEGCFHVGVNANKTTKLGVQVLPEFVVVQHERDRQVLEALKTYFKCGYIKINHGDRLCYLVRQQSHLLNIIIPFFEKHKLKTKKRVGFEKFRTIVLKMEKKEHLNEEGLNEIKQIIQQMRKYSRAPGLLALSNQNDASANQEPDESQNPSNERSSPASCAAFAAQSNEN